MKGSLQADRLEEMMSRHPLFRDYTLELPVVRIRRNTLKQLAINDVLLLHMDLLRLCIYMSGQYVADATLLACGRYRMIRCLPPLPAEKVQEKGKYESLHCLLGSFKSKSVEAGMEIDIEGIGLNKVSLVHKGKTIAGGMLVNVNNEIAVKIEKVEQ